DGLAVTGDFWKVAIGGGTISFDDDATNVATATIYLDKALAAEGVDMGDVTLALSIGNTTTFKPADVYTDSNDAVAELEMAGSDYTSSVTVGYGTLATVQLAADLADGTNKPMVVGVKAVPVDGISAAVGYTNYATGSAKGGVTGSVTADVAKLAGLDFGLTVSAIDVYLTTPETNKLYVEAKGSYEDIAAWVEYQNIAGTSNLIAKATFSGIENTSVYAKVKLNDLSDIATVIGAGASYAMGGVTYALDAEYTAATKTTTVKPSVKIAF
ncbi:MAG: hypothetical protein WC136_11760, partial [Sphaerochaeta sp.]